MVLAISIALLFVLNLATGSVRIPFADIIGILSGRYVGKESWQYIVMETRFPQALTAVLCGASLSVCGLMLQTAFRNPLAGPDVFGISSGAGLGVALVMLLMGGTLSTSMFSLYGFLAVLMAAFVGAVSVTALILFLSTLVRNSVLLLIVGLMVGYVASSAVSLLNFFASEDGVKSYMVWGMGNFGGVSMNHMLLFALLCLTGVVEHSAPGTAVCREFRNQYSPDTQYIAGRCRPADCRDDGLLRSRVLYRTGDAARCTSAVSYREP